MRKIILKRCLAVFICCLLSAPCCFSQDSSRVVLVETAYGNIKIKLYNETPKHRDNFLKLVQNHFYDSLLFHRVINTFMIQGGDPDSKNAKPNVMLGNGEKGYTIPAELSQKIFHKRGVLAGARNSDEVNPEQASSGCQFYIVQGRTWTDSLLNEQEKRITNMMAYNLVCRKHLKELTALLNKQNDFQVQGNIDSLRAVKSTIDKMTAAELPNVKPYKFTPVQREAYKTIGGTPHLDGSYTVFGEVIEGMETVDKIAALPGDRFARPYTDVRMKISIVK